MRKKTHQPPPLQLLTKPPKETPIVTINEKDYELEDLDPHVQFLIARATDLSGEAQMCEMRLKEISALLAIYQNTVSELVEKGSAKA